MKMRAFPGWNLVEYLTLRGLSGLVNLLPIEIATSIAAACGSLVYSFHSKRRKIALENLERAFPGRFSEKQLDQIARETFCNLAISLMEFFRIPRMVHEAKERFEFEGTEHLDAAFKKGNGVIFTISHLGSWEYLAFLPFLRGYPCSVIVRPIRNPYIYQWIQNLRRQTELHPIDKTRSVKEIFKRLKENELVAILIDQWAGHDGLWLDFFGRPTSTTSIPYRLAVRTGASLIPGYCCRISPGKYKIMISPPVEVAQGENAEEETTLRLNRLLEKEIEKHLPQWTWGHKRWKSEAKYWGKRKSQEIS